MVRQFSKITAQQSVQPIVTRFLPVHRSGLLALLAEKNIGLRAAGDTADAYRSASSAVHNLGGNSVCGDS